MFPLKNLARKGLRNEVANHQLTGMYFATTRYFHISHTFYDKTPTYVSGTGINWISDLMTAQ